MSIFSGESISDWTLFSSNFRDLDQADKQTQLFHGLREFLVVNRLDDVTAATEFMAAGNFTWVIRGAQHDDWHFAQQLVGFEPVQHFHPVDFRHSNIQ